MAKTHAFERTVSVRLDNGRRRNKPKHWQSRRKWNNDYNMGCRALAAAG